MASKPTKQPSQGQKRRLTTSKSSSQKPLSFGHSINVPSGGLLRYQEWGGIVPDLRNDADDEHISDAENTSSSDFNFAEILGDPATPDNPDYPLDLELLPKGWAMPTPSNRSNRSHIWSHGHKVADGKQKETWVCKYCHKEKVNNKVTPHRFISQTTSNAWNHLEKEHRIARDGTTLADKDVNNNKLSKTNQKTLIASFPTPHSKLRSSSGWCGIISHCVKVSVLFYVNYSTLQILLQLAYYPYLITPPANGSSKHIRKRWKA